MSRAAEVRAIAATDVAALVEAFAPLGWPGKDLNLFRGYYDSRARGDMACLVAASPVGLVGYMCVDWDSRYAPFRDQGIPEVMDLNVLPDWRRRGIGSALLDAAESAISDRANTAGLGVGLYSDYGAAWRLYLARGYRPDGRGVMYDGQPVLAGSSIPIDDSAVIMMTKQLAH